MLGSQEAAEDVTQDAFVRAHLNISQLGPPYNFKAWIYRIAGNLALNVIKRESRFVEVEDLESMPSARPTKRPAESEVQRDETRRAVWNAMDDIPSVYRQALILKELNNLSYPEIAQVMERSYANVRQLVHRARHRFAEAHIGRRMITEGAFQCAMLGDLVSAHHDGELTAVERSAVEEHINVCANCQATEKEMRKSSALLALIPPIIPSKAWAATVLEQIARQASPPSPVEIRYEPPKVHDVGAPQASTMDSPAPVRGASRAAPMPKSLVMLLFVAGAAGLGMIAIAVVLTLSMFFSGRSSPPVDEQKTPTRTLLMTSTQVAEKTPATSETAVLGIFSDDPTPTVSITPTETLTTSPDAKATFDQNANCRRGPGTFYETVTSFLEGQEVLIEGRNADSSWWWILLPESTAHCWVSDVAVKVSGPVAGVPIIAAPPTSTRTRTPHSTFTPTHTLQPSTATRTPTLTDTPKPSPPAPPAQLQIANKVCTDTEYSVTLGWMDVANNEDGYRVFRDGQLIATLGKNSTGYKDNPPGSGPYTYGVESFNLAGTSSRPTVFEEGCLF
jgi:RNA polymerase sigma-70 factor (ECF subfamily)